MNEEQVSVQPPAGVTFQRHFMPKELAKLWGLSADIVRRACENEPDVIRVGHGESISRRRYVSLRIPESVAVRVHKRLTTPKGKLV